MRWKTHSAFKNGNRGHAHTHNSQTIYPMCAILHSSHYFHVLFLLYGRLWASSLSLRWCGVHFGALAFLCPAIFIPIRSYSIFIARSMLWLMCFSVIVYCIRYYLWMWINWTENAEEKRRKNGKITQERKRYEEERSLCYYICENT